MDNSEEHKTKYELFVKNFNDLRKKGTNFLIENIRSNFTLHQAIHIQTIYPLYTSCDSLDEQLKIGKSERINDIFIYHYTKKSTLIPILYNQIISLCGPDDIETDEITLNEDVIFLNQKCIVFTCDHLMSKELIVKQYVIPILEKEIKYKNKKIKKTLFEYFIQRLFDNIYIINYVDSVDLLFKVNSLYYVLQNKIKNVALVIIDGVNLLDMEKVEFNLEKETQSTRKFDIQFKKKRNSYPQENNIETSFEKKIKKEEKEPLDIITAVLSSITNIYKKYNFNLVITSFDFDAYSYSKFTECGRTMMFDLKSSVTIDLTEHNVQFNFKLPQSIQNIHTFYLIEPIYNCVNCPIEFFGVVSLGEGTDVIFKIYSKGGNTNKIKEIAFNSNLIPH